MELIENKDKPADVRVKTVENKPKLYRGLVRRLHCRTLFMSVQNAVSKNRTVERRLQAANVALEPHANVEIRTGGVIRFLELPRSKHDELVELEISQDAVLGIKEAVVQTIKGDGQRPRCAYREELDYLEACRSFGKKFHDMVHKETRPPEDEDLDADELDLDEENTDAPSDAEAGKKA